MMTKLNWGILGTGWIAHEMGEALNAVNGEIYAVCDMNLESAQKYAEEFGVQKAYGSADEMIADENVDIVYIATPHNLHYQFLLKSVQAGKHVFCEKSITVNSRQLEECVAVAEEKGLVICDGMTLLHMPLYKKLKKMIEDFGNELYGDNSTIEYEMNPGYWDQDIEIKHIKWLYNDGSDQLKGYNWLKDDQISGSGLNTAAIEQAKKDGLFDTYAYVTDTTSTTYFAAYNLNRQTYVLSNGAVASKQSEKQAVDTYKAIQNRNFRLALSYAFDKANWKFFSSVYLEVNIPGDCFFSRLFMFYDFNAVWSWEILKRGC